MTLVSSRARRRTWKRVRRGASQLGIEQVGPSLENERRRQSQDHPAASPPKTSGDTLAPTTPDLLSSVFWTQRFALPLTAQPPTHPAAMPPALLLLPRSTAGARRPTRPRSPPPGPQKQWPLSAPQFLSGPACSRRRRIPPRSAPRPHGSAQGGTACDLELAIKRNFSVGRRGDLEICGGKGQTSSLRIDRFMQDHMRGGFVLQRRSASCFKEEGFLLSFEFEWRPSR